jgi:hypothetical protein
MNTLLYEQMNLLYLESKRNQPCNDNVNASKQPLLYDGIFEEILETCHLDTTRRYQKTRNIWICKIDKLLYQSEGFENNNCVEKQFHHYIIFVIMIQKSKH